MFLVDFGVLNPNLMSARLPLLSIFVKTPKSKMAADPRGRNGKNIKVTDLHNLGVDSHVLWHSKTDQDV